MNKNNIKDFSIPISIIIAGAFIAAAIYTGGQGLGGGTSGPIATAGTNTQGAVAAPTATEINIKPVDSQDHILGSLSAPVKIVEFSDLECPFCKRFHLTMQQIVDEYDGQVAWIYRHFPLDSLHSKARREAEASECAAELGGNDAFWAYVDRLFEITPANNGLDPQELYNIAEFIGLESSAFRECLNSGRYADAVEEDVQDAAASGGRGTPYSVVIAPNGKTFPLSGAQPYSAVKSLVDLALQEK